MKAISKFFDKVLDKLTDSLPYLIVSFLVITAVTALVAGFFFGLFFMGVVTGTVRDLLFFALGCGIGAAVTTLIGLTKEGKAERKAQSAEEETETGDVDRGTEYVDVYGRAVSRKPEPENGDGETGDKVTGDRVTKSEGQADDVYAELDLTGYPKYNPGQIQPSGTISIRLGDADYIIPSACKGKKTKILFYPFGAIGEYQIKTIEEIPETYLLIATSGRVG